MTDRTVMQQDDDAMAGAVRYRSSSGHNIDTVQAVSFALCEGLASVLDDLKRVPGWWGIRDDDC